MKFHESGVFRVRWLLNKKTHQRIACLRGNVVRGRNVGRLRGTARLTGVDELIGTIWEILRVSKNSRHREQVRFSRLPATRRQFSERLARDRARLAAGDVSQTEQVCRYLLVADKVRYRLVEVGDRKGTALTVVILER